MIGVIDNIGYEGKLLNFGRDNMTYAEMTNSNVNNRIEKGHIVYCTTSQYEGHYVYLGWNGSNFDQNWVKVTTEQNNVFIPGSGTSSVIQKGGSGEASGELSASLGDHTKTTNKAEVAVGKYNNSRSTSSQKTIHSIGIGTSNSTRKNAVEVLDDGRVFVINLGGFLGNTIDSNTNDVVNVISALQQLLIQLGEDLNTETTNRQNADNTLTQSINTEIQNRTNADDDLQNSIDLVAQDLNTETTNRQTVDNTLTQSINTEIQNRTNADEGLAGDIETEKQARLTKDAELEAYISNQIFGMGYDDETGDVYALVDPRNTLFNSAAIDPITGTVWVDFNL